jgi:hypothetical protein
MKKRNRAHLTVTITAFLFAACFALVPTMATSTAAAGDLACSPFKAVYAPSPAYTRDDGIHYSMTIEGQECKEKPCVSAKVHLNLYDNKETLLTRLTMHYGCAGTGWVCAVSLSCDKCDGKPSDRIVFDPVALTSDFKPVDFLGSGENTAAYALILPTIDSRFRYAPWNKFQKSFQTFTARTLPLEIASHLSTPTVWLLNRCDQ